MPNGYTVVPNVIPGTLSVGGDLDVKGEIRIGPFTPRFHLFQNAATQAQITYNLQKDGSSRDQANQDIGRLFFGDSVIAGAYYINKLGGSPMLGSLSRRIFTDYAGHNNTGNTTENTIYSKSILGNQIGANGAVRLRFHLLNTTQGATASTLRVKFGATTIFSFSVTSSYNGLPIVFEVVIGNQGSASSQRAYLVSLASGVAVSMSSSLSTENTANDTTLAVTVQNGAVSDNHTFYLCEVEQINVMGPIS